MCSLGDYDTDDKYRVGYSSLPPGVKDYYDFGYTEDHITGGYFFVDIKDFHGEIIASVVWFGSGGIIVPSINAFSLALMFMATEIFALPCFETGPAASLALRLPGRVLRRRDQFENMDGRHCGQAVKFCFSWPGSPAEVVFTSSRRIGEADNPGPFSVGGAASSGQAIVQNGDPRHSQSSWEMEGHGRWRRAQLTTMR